MAHVTGDFSPQGKYSGSPVRIVLFKEKQLLFDSHSVEKTKADDNGNRLLYPYSKLTDEFCHLAEMIFGTTAMRYSGPYSKIHDVASCEKIVFTQVFSRPDRKSVNFKKCHESSLSNFGNRESSSCSSESSLSIFRRDADSSSTMDSGFSEMSLTSSFNCSNDNFSTSSCSSMDIHDSFSGMSTRNSQSKLGIAIILAVAKERRKHNFYSNHITFVQSILHRLKQCIEYAILSPRYWLSRVLEISNDSTRRILESYTENGRGARRGYLGIIRDRLGWSRKEKGDEVFDRFCGVIQKMEVKEKNFFLSTLLTSVLTHHPSWISSHRSPPHFRCTGFKSVWSRMRSMYGLLGSSRKSSRTLVFNPHDEDLIRDVMGFVRYFFRYFLVERWEVERDESGEEKGVEEGRIGRTKTCPDLMKLGCIEEGEEEGADPGDPVVFILGEDEELVGLKRELRAEARVNVLTFPLPKMKLSNNSSSEVPPILLDSNLKRYTPDSPLQGTTLPKSVWMEKLHDELSSCNFYTGCNDVEESVAIIADTERWEVKLVSSDRRSVYRTSPGETPDTSQLVADMLEATLEMWKAGIPKEFCITHIEQRLMEVYLKADALSCLLLTADFCTMAEILTNLNCTVSDIPLLMSVVSTVYPEVNRKYGLSYQ